jgi:hypothetical protein
MVVREDGRLVNVAKVYTKSTRRKNRALLRQIIAPTFICIMVDMVDQACSLSRKFCTWVLGLTFIKRSKNREKESTA